MKRTFVFLLVFAVAVSFAAGLHLAHATTYTYTFNGPYYDDGSVAVETVGLGILWVNGTVYRWTMTASGGVANQSIITSSAAAVQVLWNASDTLNFTRVLDLTGEESEEYNIFIPSSAIPAGQYYFSVTDFANMQNPYLQTSISTDGVTSDVVERRSLNTTGTVSFVMAQYGTYTLTVQSDLGSYAQLFVAENIFEINIPILAGVFPITTSTSPTFTAERINASMIGISYSDPSNDTDWLYLNITHRSGTLTVFDYTTNNTGSSQTVLWNDADSDKAYTVTGVASIGGVEYTWIVTVPKTAAANPWLGVFDWLGQDINTLPNYYMGWPDGMTSAQIAQLVATALIMLFLGIGSFRSAGASMLIAWVAGGVMMALGWFNGGAAQAGASGLPLWAFAGVLALLIHFSEKKAEGAGLS